jgi:hypothetical protein
MIAVKCPCGAELKAPDDSRGKNGKCPHCGTSFPIVPWLFCPECRADISVEDDGHFTCNCKITGRRRYAFGGPPGTTWTNTTDRTRYQLCSTIHEDGGFCFRASGRIGPLWPLPIVTGCHCTHRPIHLRETSLPFTDVGEELAKTTPNQRDLIFGRNNRLVLDAGLVSWSDLIGRFSGIEFDYVIYNKGLSLESILAAGVPNEEARESWKRVSVRRAGYAGARPTLIIKSG